LELLEEFGITRKGGGPCACLELESNIETASLTWVGALSLFYRVDVNRYVLRERVVYIGFIRFIHFIINQST
jgi:hypothetical protein